MDTLLGDGNAGGAPEKGGKQELGSTAYLSSLGLGQMAASPIQNCTFQLRGRKMLDGLALSKNSSEHFELLEPTHGSTTLYGETTRWTHQQVIKESGTACTVNMESTGVQSMNSYYVCSCFKVETYIPAASSLRFTSWLHSLLHNSLELPCGRIIVMSALLAWEWRTILRRSSYY